MKPAGPFEIRGFYRDQSRMSQERSCLAGVWIDTGDAHLDSEQVSLLIKGDDLWSGKYVTLAAAEVGYRSGVFSGVADALYYTRFFSADPGTTALETDILDVPKLRSHWHRRIPLLRAMLDTHSFEALQDLTASIDDAMIDEYFCHEAGHLLGWSVHDKYDRGYFRPLGKPAWPLIFVEEFRADMHGLGFAARTLPPDRARRVLLYHVAHRLGLLLDCRISGSSAGSVPRLLYSLLAELDWLRISEQPDGLRVAFASAAPDIVAETMVRCERHALRELTERELETADALDVAISNATYFRHRHSVGCTADGLERAVEASASRMYR